MRPRGMRKSPGARADSHVQPSGVAWGYRRLYISPRAVPYPFLHTDASRRSIFEVSVRYQSRRTQAQALEPRAYAARRGARWAISIACGCLRLLLANFALNEMDVIASHWEGTGSWERS